MKTMAYDIGLLSLETLIGPVARATEALARLLRRCNRRSGHLKSTVEALLAEERAQNHHIVADRLEMAVGRSGDYYACPNRRCNRRHSTDQGNPAIRARPRSKMVRLTLSLCGAHTNLGLPFGSHW